MEELLVIALGALAVIAAPLVPGVRPLAKSAVKGGMALGSAATAAAVAAGQQWDNLADKVGSKKSELNLPIVDGAATVVANAAQATSDAAAAVADTAKSAAAAVVDTARSAVAAVTDTAQSTAATVTDTAQSTATAVTDGAAGAGTDALDGAAAPVEAVAAVIDGDDLTKISGIGAKTAGILAAAGVTTYAQLAAATEGGLREILESAGPRYRLLDPTTWPDQAGKLIAEESAE